VRIRRPLRRSDFTPPPAVDTVLLELKLRAEPLLDPALARNFSTFVYNCYHDPRAFRQLYRGDLKPSQLNTQQWLACFSKSVEAGMID
jgi:16S rRNA A1518/A1519 N6-dimethyltransferase RsmA/KsgA/DIM1 with predicted DNA glycosylase/AP lyase activity